MGLLTWIQENKKKSVLAEQDRLVRLQEERADLAKEIEIREAVKREEDLLEEEKRKVRALKYSRVLGWLK